MLLVNVLVVKEVSICENEFVGIVVWNSPEWNITFFPAFIQMSKP